MVGTDAVVLKFTYQCTSVYVETEVHIMLCTVECECCVGPSSSCTLQCTWTLCSYPLGPSSHDCCHLFPPWHEHTHRFTCLWVFSRVAWMMRILRLLDYRWETRIQEILHKVLPSESKDPAYGRIDPFSRTRLQCWRSSRPYLQVHDKYGLADCREIQVQLGCPSRPEATLSGTPTWSENHLISQIENFGMHVLFLGYITSYLVLHWPNSVEKVGLLQFLPSIWHSLWFCT